MLCVLCFMLSFVQSELMFNCSLRASVAFGMTEVGTVTSVPYEDIEPRRRRKLGTIGVPLQDVMMKVTVFCIQHH